MSDSEHTLLVIDDNQQQRKIFEIILSGAGYTVLTAGSGEEGFGILQENQVDLVLCDVQMPKMDGREFLTTLRSQEAGGRTPVILLSAASDDYLEEGTELGADGVCSKSEVKQTLFPMLKRLL